MNKYLVFSPEVQEAFKKGIPVVALESNIVSFGLPYPSNVETMKEGMRIMREEGVVPAMIGLINGKIKIGLTDEELELFGKAEGAIKVSRWDIPYVLQTKKMGATTVASTMICASLAGIKIFATGGPGGVHRDWQRTMDISADLDEFILSDVAVVCGGPKCILDLPATLEYLETKGIPIIGYGVKNMPAMLVRDTGIPLQISYDNLSDIAKMIKVKWDLGIKGGVIIANPIPEKDAMEVEYIEKVMTQSMKETEEQGVIGKDVTPVVLQKMIEMTKGKSLESAINLFKNNVRVGAKLAIEYYKNA